MPNSVDLISLTDGTYSPKQNIYNGTVVDYYNIKNSDFLWYDTNEEEIVTDRYGVYVPGKVANYYEITSSTTHSTLDGSVSSLPRYLMGWYYVVDIGGTPTQMVLPEGTNFDSNILPEGETNLDVYASWGLPCLIRVIVFKDSNISDTIQPISSIVAQSSYTSNSSNNYHPLKLGFKCISERYGIASSPGFDTSFVNGASYSAEIGSGDGCRVTAQGTVQTSYFAVQPNDSFDITITQIPVGYKATFYYANYLTKRFDDTSLDTVTAGKSVNATNTYYTYSATGIDDDESPLNEITTDMTILVHIEAEDVSQNYYIIYNKEVPENPV
ncbi:MAG: hypothetical protein J6X18_17145 [Bacteroidales bacterium]|nr:hypothetical protein [Bacteroidales bacterium]